MYDHLRPASVNEASGPPLTALAGNAHRGFAAGDTDWMLLRFAP
jgi:hypothetical protein